MVLDTRLNGRKAPIPKGLGGFFAVFPILAGAVDVQWGDHGMKLFLSHPIRRIKWVDQWALDRDAVSTSTTSAKVGKTVIQCVLVIRESFRREYGSRVFLHQWSQPSNPTATCAQRVALSLALQRQSQN